MIEVASFLKIDERFVPVAEYHGSITDPYYIDGAIELDRLIAEGVVTPARRPKRRAGAPIRGAGAVSVLIADQRR